MAPVDAHRLHMVRADLALARTCELSTTAEIGPSEGPCRGNFVGLCGESAMGVDVRRRPSHSRRWRPCQHLWCRSAVPAVAPPCSLRSRDQHWSARTWPPPAVPADRAESANQTPPILRPHSATNDGRMPSCRQPPVKTHPGLPLRGLGAPPNRRQTRLKLDLRLQTP
eukprot:SAG11_NODE_12924_length_678_cov_4.290155_1_plen_168_part_00